MSLSEKIFGKESAQLTVQDLRDFFLSKQEETSVLEFKSGDVEYEGIYREIAAFLNTEGGVIVVGTPKETRVEQKGEKVVYCEGELIVSKKSRAKIFSYKKYFQIYLLLQLTSR